MGKDFAAILKARLKEKFPWLKMLEPYKGMGKKTLFICTRPWCGHEWGSTPDNLVNKVKYGCPECAKLELKIKWQKETLEWLKKERPDLILRGNLVDYDTPADWKCAKPECGYEWSVNFESIRGAGSGCWKCGIERIRQSRTFPEGKFRDWLKKERPFIELLEYTSSSLKAKFHCLNPTCDISGGKYWKTQPEILRLQNRGQHGCRDCGWKANGKNQSIPEIEIREWLKENKPTLTMGSGYMNTTSKVEFGCNTCGYEWMPSISSIFYNNAGCPSCVGNAPLTEETFNQRLKEVSGNTIQLIGALKNGSTSTLFKCLQNDCGNQWAAKPYRLVSSSPTGCPACKETGFNHLLPAWMYLMERGSELQFGITNDLPGRLATHYRDGWTEVDIFGPSIGQKIFLKEAELKKYLKKSIGLEIKGKRENWYKEKLQVQSLEELFHASEIQPLMRSDIISLEEGNPKRTRQEIEDEVYPKEWDNLPISKFEAYQKGVTRFFDGKRCRQGHLSPRWASGPCCECSAISLRRSTKENKEARARAISEANEFRKCPECGFSFLMTPEMRQDKIYCSKKCAGAESKRNYDLANPEKVTESKRKWYERSKSRS